MILTMISLHILEYLIEVDGENKNSFLRLFHER
jgi:hypothetical protein